MKLHSDFPEDFYTIEQLRAIVNRKRIMDIIRWLYSNEIPFLYSIDGQPRVLKSSIYQKFGIKIIKLQQN